MDDYWLTLGLPGNAGRCDPVWPSNMFVFAIYFGGRAGEEVKQVFRTYYHPVSCQWTILVLRPQFRFRLELVQVKPFDVHFPRAHKLAAWRVARPCWREKMEDAKVVCLYIGGHLVVQNPPSFTSTCSCRSRPTRSTLSGTVASKLFMVYTPQSKVKSFKTSTAWIKGSKLLLGDNAEILMPYISVQGLTWLLYLMKLSLEYFRSNIFGTVPHVYIFHNWDTHHSTSNLFLEVEWPHPL